MGAALAFWCRSEARVALALCGEGAAATGAWHEAVNAAAVLGLPVVFAVENNQYAHSLPNEGVSRLAYTAHRADGYGIPGIVVDGNDVLEVYAAAREAVERARAGEGPSLVEAVTFRLAGHHVGDPAAYVDAETRRSWLARDPLPRFEEYLGSRGLLDEARRVPPGGEGALPGHPDPGVGPAAGRSGAGGDARGRPLPYEARGAGRRRPGRRPGRGSRPGPGRGDGPRRRRWWCSAPMRAASAGRTASPPGCGSGTAPGE